MKMIRVKNEGGVGVGTHVLTECGEEIGGVTGVTLKIRPNDVVTAEVSVRVASVDVLAHPILDLASLEEAAAAHGYRLTKV